MTELKQKATSDRVEIFRSGEKDPILVQQAKADTRAYIHPIVAPDGNGILTEDTPSHHPWQHGLYVDSTRSTGWVLDRGTPGAAKRSGWDFSPRAD